MCRKSGEPPPAVTLPLASSFTLYGTVSLLSLADTNVNLAIRKEKRDSF